MEECIVFFTTSFAGSEAWTVPQAVSLGQTIPAEFVSFDQVLPLLHAGRLKAFTCI